MVSPLLVMAGLLLTKATADMASVFPMDQVEDWQRRSIMKLSITAPEENNAVDLTFNVIPLTTSLGLNQSDFARGVRTLDSFLPVALLPTPDAQRISGAWSRWRGPKTLMDGANLIPQAILIRGSMVSATPSNYVNLTNPDSLTYLCCDDMSNTSNITPTMMINTLMSNRPKAILLYSVRGNCCGLSGNNLPYQTIFTMSNSDEADETLNITTTAAGVVLATIAGNVTTAAQESQDSQNGSNSAVAMSILYSITGLITLLFLIIIATGAIRAHRYPERYGPRSGYGGRPRQSRAKGLARAVLETIPIVKFGEANPPKPDPAIELEGPHQEPTSEPRDLSMGTRLSAIPEEAQPQQHSRKAELTSVQESGIGPDTPAGSVASQEASASGANGEAVGDEHLGCSICTEDFKVGEDVRVLPCDHKFHPACVDPWLMNVSGTCPCGMSQSPREPLSFPDL